MAYDSTRINGLSEFYRTLNRQSAGSGSKTGSRFDSLLADPLLQSAGPGQAMRLLGLGGDKENEDQSAFEAAMLGGMGELNAKAMATLARVAGPEDMAKVMQWTGMGAVPGAAQALAQPSRIDPAAWQAMIGAEAAPDPVRAAVVRHRPAAANRAAGPVSPPDPEPSIEVARKAASRYQAVQRQTQPVQVQSVAEGATEQPGSGAGSLSARFESGSDGIAAIGYDRVGGTSYGKYQLSSRMGSMARFLDFLREAAPHWADRLSQAGPADTGSSAGAVPEAWKAIAAESPSGFEAAQDRFIQDHYYHPARQRILDLTGLDVEVLSPAVSETLLSTAVQHGAYGAARIFTSAARSLARSEAKNFDRALIDSVYDARKRLFPSSSHSVRQAVRSRLEREKAAAFQLLADGSA